MERPVGFTGNPQNDKPYEEQLVGHPIVEQMIDTGRRLMHLNEQGISDQVERIIMSMHRKKGSQSKHKSIRTPAVIDWFIDEAIPELFPGLVGFSEKMNVISMIGCLVLAEKFGDRLRMGGKAPKSRFQSFRDEIEHLTDDVYDAQNIVNTVKDMLHALEAVKSDVNQLDAVDASLSKIIANVPDRVWNIAVEQLALDRRFASFTKRQTDKLRKQEREEEQLMMVAR